MKVAMIIVSHSSQIAQGLANMIEEMVPHEEDFTIFPVGGADREGKELGTSPERIYECIINNSHFDAILIFTDLGSALLSAEAAIDSLSDTLKEKVHVLNTPLVESAFAACIKATISTDIQAILDAANRVKAY